MIYDDFLILKLDINKKNELRQKIKYAQTLVIYSSRNIRLFKNYMKIN